MSSSHPLLSTSSASHSGTYNPIWSPASISPSANDLMSGPGSGANAWKLKLFSKKCLNRIPSKWEVWWLYWLGGIRGELRVRIKQTNQCNIYHHRPYHQRHHHENPDNHPHNHRQTNDAKLRCYYTNMDYLTPPGMHSGLNVPVSQNFHLLITFNV